MYIFWRHQSVDQLLSCFRLTLRFQIVALWIGRKAAFAERNKVDGWYNSGNQPTVLTSNQFLETIENLRPLLAQGGAPLSPTASSVQLCDPNRLAATLKRLRPLLDEERRRFTANPWAMAGIGRYEVRNCAVLAQLWDKRITGALASAFLASFIERIGVGNSSLPTPGELAAHYVVRTEHCPNGMQSDRVDITIESESFLIGIEAKIDADVRENQLEDYCTVIRARAARLRIEGKKHCVVYLTTDGRRASGVISASWRDIALAARQCVTEAEDQNSKQGWLIQCFADHLERL